MLLSGFKKNARQYTALEKMEITSLVVNGGVAKNIGANFNVSQPTLRRWKNKYLALAVNGFKRKSKAKSLPLAKDELNEMEIGAKHKLLSLFPKHITDKLKKSGEYRDYCIRLLQSRQCSNIREACKSVGMAMSTYYENRDLDLTDRRRDFPGLLVLDLLLENKGLDRDSIIHKLSGAGIPLARKVAGNLRWQADSFIKRHRLRENPAIYMFLNCDDAWCMDFMHLYGDDGTVRYLLKVIDDRSHIDIINSVLENATTANVVKVLQDAFIQKGRIPASIKTDRGTQFKVQFGEFLKKHDIEHFKSYPRFP